MGNHLIDHISSCNTWLGDTLRKKVDPQTVEKKASRQEAAASMKECWGFKFWWGRCGWYHQEAASAVPQCLWGAAGTAPTGQGMGRKEACFITQTKSKVICLKDRWHGWNMGKLNENMSNSGMMRQIHRVCLKKFQTQLEFTLHYYYYNAGGRESTQEHVTVHSMLICK